MLTTPPVNQEHCVLIGDEELPLVIQIIWIDDEIGGWMWTAVPDDDDIPFWMAGEQRDLTPERALAAAIARLTDVLN